MRKIDDLLVTTSNINGKISDHSQIRFVVFCAGFGSYKRIYSKSSMNSYTSQIAMALILLS